MSARIVRFREVFSAAVAVLLLLAGCSTAIAADRTDDAALSLGAASAMERAGRYDEAIRRYAVLAEAGNLEASYRLALLLLKGPAGKRDVARSIKLLTQAAEAGHAGAQQKLGLLLYAGQDIARDQKAAFAWFEKAATQGLAAAQYCSAYMLLRGQGVSKDVSRAAKLFRAAADQGHAGAMESLAFMHKSGLGGLARDELKRYLWLRKSVENGNVSALLELADIAAGTLMVTTEPKPGGGYLSTEETIAADALLAANKELVIRVTTRSVADRLAEAETWLEQAVDKHVPGALLARGNLELRGDPPTNFVPGDDVLYFREDQATKAVATSLRPSAADAADDYRRAIAEGSVAARLNLARLLELGHGVPRDLETARKLYEQADQGVFEGPARLGLLRIAFADVWAGIERRHDLLRTALSGSQAVSDKDIVVRPRKGFIDVVIQDSVGRRYFSGTLPAVGYRVPPHVKDLVLWDRFSSGLSEEVEIKVGGHSIAIPSGDGFGIRLDAAALLAGAGLQVAQPADYSVNPKTVPEATRAASRIMLIGQSGDAKIHVSTEDELIGFTEDLSENDRFFVPDVPGLALDLRTGTDADSKAARLAVVVDGGKPIELIASAGCVVHVRLSPAGLKAADVTDGPPRACDAMSDDERIVLLKTQGGEVLGHVAKAPDESITGISGLGINRGLAFLHMRLGSRWDELLRAYRIVRRIDLRDEGPNSLSALTDGLGLSEAEAAMGNVKTAQALLDSTIVRLESATYASDELRSDADFRMGALQLQLGHYGEAEQFLMLAHAYRLRYSEAAARPRYEGLPRIYDALAELSVRLHRFDEAIAYKLRSFMLSGKPERAETFATEIGPGDVIPIVEWLKLTKRDHQADSLLSYLHSEAKREFARDLPEPLVFPLDLTVFETTVGPVDRSPTLAGAMANLGEVYEWMGRYKEALPLLAQEERTLGNVFGENSPQATEARANVATAQRRGGMLDEAVKTARRAWQGAETYTDTREAMRQESAAASVVTMAPAGLALLEALYAADPQGNAAESFGVAQRLHSSSTALAMESFGERLALKNEQAKAFLRQRQDLAERLIALDRSLAVAMSKPGATDPITEAAIRESIAATERQMADLQRSRPREIVDLDDLARVPTLSAAQIKQSLAENELLISYVVLDEACFAWTVDSQGQVKWFRLPVTGVALEKGVARFRAALGSTASGRGVRPLIAASEETGIADELSAAHALYLALVAPLHDVLQGKKQLTIVANGVLTSLPFHALVSAAPDAAAANPWRAARWLVRDYAISLMPSVASLRVLTRSERNGPAQAAYLGIGDPVLDGEAEPMSKTTALFETAGLSRGGVSNYFRDGRADAGKLRSLPRLSDTATEVRAVAQSLLAQGPADLLLGKDATETRLKALPLDRFRIIHFATHGLVSGDIEGLAEPALVMSPPAVPTELDDGLLTASEIARLKLNASWIILSACNTAGGERPEAEALSGLARAFFYAGARSVLVSHWPVISSAAVKLTTRAFDEMARDVSVGRAEALRRSMLALIDEGEPYEADPNYWAPFVIVGEGGRY